MYYLLRQMCLGSRQLNQQGPLLPFQLLQTIIPPGGLIEIVLAILLESLQIVLAILNAAPKSKVAKTFDAPCATRIVQSLI